MAEIGGWKGLQKSSGQSDHLKTEAVVAKGMIFLLKLFAALPIR